MIGIYQIKNITNDRIYIGQTVSLKRRKIEHFRRLKNNNHHNSYLQNDFNKCGKKCFEFQIILETNCAHLLNDFEQSYLNEYWDNKKNCYNILKEPCVMGYKLTDDGKKQMCPSCGGPDNPYIWAEKYFEIIKKSPEETKE